MTKLILSALLMFFLPGFTLINAIYPAEGELDDELDLLYRITYGIGISAAIVVILGFVLGNIPTSGEKGLFASQTLSIGLILLTVLFFLVGWYRGGYQRLSIISPKLCKTEPEVPSFEDEGIEKVKRLQRLAKKRGSLKEKMRYTKRKMKKSEGEEKEKLKKKKRRLEEKIEKVEQELKEAERDREMDF